VTILPTYISTPDDFWAFIDSQNGWGGRRPHRSDCRRPAGEWERCTCGAISEWAQDRDRGCIALNSNGERCSTELRGSGIPFCRKYHQTRAIEALASAIPELLRHHSRPGDELGEFFAALVKACGLTSRQTADAARHLTRWVAQEIEDRLEEIALAEDIRLADAVTEARAPRPEKTALYRHFDTDGVLLYVGITNNPAARFKSHAQHAPWMDFAASHTGEWFESRDEALAAESAAIRAELPVFNKAGATADRDERAKTYLLAHNAWEHLTTAI
jgi:predicted GIY-YIG superfamily endonuclease